MQDSRTVDPEKNKNCILIVPSGRDVSMVNLTFEKYDMICRYQLITGLETKKSCG